MSVDELKQQEMNTELRRARTWLIVVGALMFAFDMILFYVVPMPTGLADIPPEFHSLRTKYAIYSVILFAAFIGLWIFSKHKPKLCLILGLCLFWGVQLWGMTQDSSQIYKGLIIKILFTLALIRGIKSASRAEDLRAELGKVFE